MGKPKGSPIKITMARVLQQDFAKQVWEKYKKYISENPETVSQLEATSRVLSYIIAGRFEDSQILSELVYLASNLLVLINDAIIQTAYKVLPKLSVTEERIKRFLTVLEYGEVFIEMAAGKKWGDTGKWTLIVNIQLTKAALRFLLLWKERVGIQPTPPISPIDRDSYTKQFKVNPAQEMTEFEENIEGEPSNGLTQVTFTLKRSGRTIRRLSAAPPLNFRSWKVPKESTEVDDDRTKPRFYQPTVLSPQRLWAESMYISRPLVHLLSMYLFGQSSWKPWIISGGVDITSLCMMGDTKNLNPKEKSEIKRRTLMLLYYLLRSPFYDVHSKTKIIGFLRLLADSIPGVGIFLRPMIEYLPNWQKVYFYLWST